MKATLRVEIFMKGRGFYASVSKTFLDFPFVPNAGTTVEHPPWQHRRETQHVNLFISDDKEHAIVMHLGTEEVSNEEQAKQRIEEYEACGWRVGA